MYVYINIYVIIMYEDIRRYILYANVNICEYSESEYIYKSYTHTCSTHVPWRNWSSWVGKNQKSRVKNPSPSVSKFTDDIERPHQIPPQLKGEGMKSLQV